MDRNQPLQPPSPQPRPPESAGSSSSILLVFASFLAIFSMVLFPSQSNLSNNLSILHQVPEGHVGVYWRGGALLKTITDPGFHLKLPLITQFVAVQVTLQTDQVVNRLRKEYVYDTLVNYGVNYDNIWIYDKIHHEINQFCSSHSLQQVYIDVFDQLSILSRNLIEAVKAYVSMKLLIDETMKDALQGDCTRYAPGIEIVSVRVTKPTIPNSIRKNFEDMEVERTKVLIAVESQRVVEKEAETKKKMAISEAEKNANVSRILMEQKLMEKESSRRQQEIDNHIYLAREKSLADANYYRVLKEAEANKLKLTPQFLELKFIEAIADNTKIFFGDKARSVFLLILSYITCIDA
ncbi:hypothetical protein Csa_018275 [Cucumis sativus]|nr:hypothetical protein Csa_018275 [Cucumis sativus]